MLNPVLAWPLRRRGSLPLRSLSLGRRRSVFPIYPIVVSGRLHLDIGDIVVGHFLLDGDDMLDQRVWAPDCGHGGGDTTARVNSDGKSTKKSIDPRKCGHPRKCSPFWGAEGQTWRRSRSEASGTSATPGASRPSSGASISPSRSTRGSSFRPRCVPYASSLSSRHSKSQVPPLHRRRLRSPTTATAAGPTAVSTHWNYRGTSNDSSRSSRATGRWSPIAHGRTSCPRGPPPGSELGAFRASSTSRHRPSRSWRGGCVQRHPRSLHGRPPRRRGTSASERP